MPLKLLLDENLRSGALWRAIEFHQQASEHRLDILRVGDAIALPLGSNDDAIVRWAAEQNRILISQDAQTLVGALGRLLAAGESSPGVVLLRRGLDVRTILELLVLLAYASEPDEWQNGLHWLP